MRAEEAAGVLDAGPDNCRAAEGAGIGQPRLERGVGEAFPGAFLECGIVRHVSFVTSGLSTSREFTLDTFSDR